MSSLLQKSGTDFASLKAQLPGGVKAYQGRSWTDFLIDACTPICIFLLVASVIYHLLDVRYVFTEMHDKNLRMVVFFFLMGVVAINRLVAKEGSEESMLYIALFAGSMGLYTCATTEMYKVGSVARHFMDDSRVATFFNMGVVGLVWWVTNRLTHECCVDEDPSAGDIGILTGTARRIQKAMAPAGERKESIWRTKRSKEPVFSMNVIEPVDPTEWRKPEKKARSPVGAATKRLSNRHPGISIFYFSVPAMLLFTIGLRVVQHDQGKVLMGQIYLGVYTVAALSLLMLTSLAGLREYFRARRTHLPGGLGWFWLGLGAAMIAIVLIGALHMPRPGLPPMAHIEYHETDPWVRGSTFQAKPVAAKAVDVMRQSRFMDRLGKGVLVCIGLLAAYGALRGLGAMAARLAKRRDLLPQFLVRFFAWLDRLLQRLARIPKLPSLPRRRTVSREIATCSRYRNSMGDLERSQAMSVADHIAYAYDALCALAYDLGVPRSQDQTPYEFVSSFPKELSGLREDAAQLTELYVRSAYSLITYDESALDLVRKFWITYERARRRLVK